MANILLIEDDLTLADLLVGWLSREGYRIEHESTGNGGRTKLLDYGFDLAIIDWELGEFSGIEICREARERGLSLPILILTGRNDLDSTEGGLQSGADDYLTKPFAAKELSARLRALMRRSDKPFIGLELKVRDLTLVQGTNTIVKSGVEISLTPNEYNLMEFLLRNPNRLFSPKELIDHVWSSTAEVSEAALTTCIKRLRQKIDNPDSPSLIKSVYGGGYTLES